MALRLAASHADQLLHVYGIGWHHFDGQRWVHDDSGHAKRAVLEVFREALADSVGDKILRADVTKCESSNGITGVLDVAAALPEFAVTVRNLDADPYLLNVANGTLDLRTLELRPHSPADRMTKICRGAYLPGTESKVWTTFLERILPDADVRGFIQRYAGVGLLGTVREHMLVIGTGVGDNGKTVLDGAIRSALGDYAIAAEPDLFMHREGAHPTGEMDLLGVRWVAVSESERDRRLAEATMKRLTGGDTIRARRMRKDFVEFDPSHTPMMITNHLPKVTGDDRAVWKRLRVIPFAVVIPKAEQDLQLGERLELEADGVLSWIVDGWRWYQDSGLDEPAGVRSATDTYHRDSDDVGRFIGDCCDTTDPVAKATTTEVFTAWIRWCNQEGLSTLDLSQKAFGKLLDGRGYPVTKRTMDGRWRTGIAVKEGWE
jgi:putative DNA primase/helicase